jgi:hypothetical protein
MTVSVEESDDVDGGEGGFITSSRKEAIFQPTSTYMLINCFLPA